MYSLCSCKPSCVSREKCRYIHTRTHTHTVGTYTHARTHTHTRTHTDIDGNRTTWQVAPMNQAVRVESLLQGSPAWYAKPEILTGDLVRMVDRERITVYMKMYRYRFGYGYRYRCQNGWPRASRFVCVCLSLSLSLSPATICRHTQPRDQCAYLLL